MNNNYLVQKNRGEIDSPHEKSFDIKSFCKNTICSLNDVECFLNKLCYYHKYFYLYKFLK